MRSWKALALVVVTACGGQVAADEEAPDPTLSLGTESQGRSDDPPMLGVHQARGEAARTATSSVDMTWHNGDILTSSSVQAIFWGTSWGNSSFVGDKIRGLDTLYGGLGASGYAQTNTEYRGTNGQVGAAVAYAGHIVDTSATTFRKSPRTSQILAEVCKVVTSPVANGYYPVYTDVRRGHASYCAWHSYGMCGSIPVEFGFFFSLDGDAGCDPGDTSTNHSQGLAALANVSGHEYSETVTDPRNGGWWDSSGQENADKCAWAWPTPVPLVSIGGQDWKIQGNWSNAAYDSGTGYPNRSGQNGCLFTQ